jgi:hypothetical protein
MNSQQPSPSEPLDADLSDNAPAWRILYSTNDERRAGGRQHTVG